METGLGGWGRGGGGNGTVNTMMTIVCQVKKHQQGIY